MKSNRVFVSKECISIHFFHLIDFTKEKIQVEYHIIEIQQHSCKSYKAYKGSYLAFIFYRFVSKHLH